MRSRLEVGGWAAFLLGTVVFLISGLIEGDPWVIAASLLFLGGIVAILVAVSGSGE